MPLNFRALSSFGFSFFAHSCFSRFWAALPIFVQTSDHRWWGLVVAWILNCSICDWEHESFTIFGVTISFELSLRARTSDESKFYSSSMSAAVVSPFQIPPTYNTDPRNIPGNTFAPNWWSLDWSLAQIGWFSTMDPTGKTGLLNASPNRLS